MRAAGGILFAVVVAGAASAGEIPTGPFTQEACVACHERETPDLVSAWRAGPHGRGSDGSICVACHGARHERSAAKARMNQACVGCHGGEESTVARSYFTSKHGVIARLEGARWDWSQALAEANYRAPTCAYCHMHEGGHGLSAKDEAVRASCSDCHSTRYADVIFEAGERSLKIGSLKVREAETAIRSATESGGLTEKNTKSLDAKLARMREGAFFNLRLGLGHHSPDYQWWYGQAALDGDLIRIKAWITRVNREKPGENASTVSGRSR